MKLFIWCSFESWNELVLPHNGLQGMAVPKFYDVCSRLLGVLTLAFGEEIFAFLDASISHSLLRLQPLVFPDLIFEVFDLLVSLPDVGLFLEVLHQAHV